MKILFICQGNVGRSQIAEAYYNTYTHSNNAFSAGVRDVAAKYNNHPTPIVIEAMKEESIDISKQIIKQITTKMVEDAEDIYIYSAIIQNVRIFC